MRQSLESRFDQQQGQGIDLSPLLDVVFILLIFFIVTTVFVRESGVDVQKPQAVSTTELERNVIIIAITHHGEVMFDSTNIGVVGVRSTVAQLIRQQAKPVVIQADKRVPTDLLVKVLDQTKLAGAEHVSIATTGN
jgi:biopolymer transport protein ExbD